METAATLARAGRSVAVLDSAFATQGLATYVEGRIDGDATAVATGSVRLDDALYDCEFDVPGSVAVCPAHAPFERLARAKTPECAQRLESVIAEADERFDHVLLDVPPVAANQAVGAVTTAERRVLVVPASRRGVDLLPRQQGRLRDVGASPTAIVATSARTPDAVAVADADHEIPAGEPNVTEPTSLDPDSDLAPAVAKTMDALLGVDLGLTFEEDGLLG